MRRKSPEAQIPFQIQIVQSGRHHHKALPAAFSLGQVNPLQKLKIKKVHKEKEIKYWQTADDINKVIEETTGTWRTINYIGFFIGARISEILNIKWSDVDFINSKLRIQSSGDYRTKSRKFRVVVMPNALKAYLLTLKKELAKNKKIKVDNVVVYVDGSVPTMASASSYLRKRYKQIGFKGFHAHCLHHTFTARSEEHTSELQSLIDLVCRLLLEKKKFRFSDE